MYNIKKIDYKVFRPYLFIIYLGNYNYTCIKEKQLLPIVLHLNISYTIAADENEAKQFLFHS